MSRAAPAAHGGPGVVGREHERGRVDAFTARLESGVWALLLRGEPGIGKTTMWGVALDRCRAAGAQILRTRAAEEEVPLTFGGLADLLDEAGPEAFDAGEHDAPFIVGRAVLQHLRARARRRAVVLAVDDLQWLDAGSAHALRFAIRRLDLEPIGILATLRTGSTDVLELSATLPPGRLERLDLGPLSLTELRQVLDRVVDHLSQPALRQIYGVAAGNPLHALELARGLAQGWTASVPPMPASLHSAIARRLDALPVELGPLLAVLAAAGPVRMDRLSAVLTDVDESVVRDRVSRAEQEGVLVVDDDLSVSVAHPVIAAVAYGRVGQLTRRALHARLAEIEPHPDVRARHLALSTIKPDHHVASLVSEAAARAGRRGAYQTAAELAGHSLAITPDGEEDERRDRGLLRVRMLAAMGEVGRALGEVGDLIDTLPPGVGRAAALVQRAELEDHDLEAGERSLSRALVDAGDDQRLRGQVLDQLGWLQGVFRGDIARGIRHGHEAYELSVRIGDPELRLSSAAGLSTMEALHGTPRVDLGNEAIELERQLGRPLLWGGPRVLMAEQLLWSGELARARELFESANREGAAAGNERWLAYGLYNLAAVECAAGDLRRADLLVEQAMQTARDCEDAHVESWTRLRRAMVSAWLGHADAARAAAEQRLAEAHSRGERPGVARVRTVLGILALSEDDTAEGVTQLREAVRILADTGYAHPGAIPALPNAVEALASAGDLSEARELLARLSAESSALDNDLVRALHDRSRGVVQLASGAAADAARSLAASVATFDRIGYAPDAARALLHLGRAWTRQGRRSRAAQVLADARTRFLDMGAMLWESQTRAELERVAPGRASGVLTATERRIADLVAQGRRNREIAQTLFVSPATVEAHLTRIYRKLGIRSRSELARLVVAGDL